MATTYEKIQSYTLGSPSTSISFTSIGSGYTDLRIVFVPKASTDTGALIRYNNDTSSLYSWTYMYGDGSGAYSGRASSQNRIYLSQVQDVNATPSLITCDIFSYAGGTNKTCLIEYAADKNGSGSVSRYVGLYSSTSAITRVDLIGVSNFDTGTIATLYGILKA